MKPVHDWLVAAFAVGFGCLFILVAAGKAEAFFSLPKPRLLVQAIGPRAARAVVGTIGAAMIIMGVLIARGWRMPW